MKAMATRNALVAGASRGLGLGLVRELLRRGWSVTATVRPGRPSSALAGLQREFGEACRIAELDIKASEQIAALGTDISSPLDLLFVNAGISNGESEAAGDISTESFFDVMLTNALGPVRVIESLADHVVPTGTIAVMSSNLASVANNTVGGWEVYRASKAALNTLMRSYAARTADKRRTLLAISPGWVRTDMGGDAAPLDVETSCRGMLDVIERQHGKPGLSFLDYQGATIAW